MASIYDLKPKFQALLRPLVGKLAGAGVTANQITVLAMLLSFIAGGLVYFMPDKLWPLLLIPLVLFLRMALNAIDGMLAREHNMKSALGAILNELGDVLSDVALYLPLAIVTGFNGTLIFVVVILAIFSELTGVVAVQIGAQRRYDGPMGKSDRAFVFGVICLIAGTGYSVVPWLDYVLLIMSGLLIITIVNRSRRALAEVQ
jgi:CDP-diacylglycerol--glycerol-3-phosphate 3-phosphatidyltransferase